jgi:uncharacterized protein YhjY with autotransporter beta-barrel domain
VDPGTSGRIPKHLRFPNHSVRLFEEVQSLSLLFCGTAAVKFSDAAWIFSSLYFLGYQFTASEKAIGRMADLNWTAMGS